MTISPTETTNTARACLIAAFKTKTLNHIHPQCFYCTISKKKNISQISTSMSEFYCMRLTDASSSHYEEHISSPEPHTNKSSRVNIPGIAQLSVFQHRAIIGASFIWSPEQRPLWSKSPCLTCVGL